MKPMLYFALLFLCAFQTTAQTVPSSCTAPPTVVRQYADDADYMALQRINALGNTYKDSIKIPEVWADTPLRAMLAVFNATVLPARDSVVSIYRIHEYATPTLHMIFFTADSNENYMKQLKLNVYPTGDATFDGLGSLYTIKNIQYLGAPTTNWHDVTLELDSAYNTPVLKEEYATLSGLKGAPRGTLLLYGDSNHIAYTVTANYVKLDYTRGWSNCMDQNGCDKKRTWTFHVSWNCDVTYIGSQGDPVNPVNSIADAETKFIRNIYPNPANDRITISGIDKHTPYTIYSLMGNKITEGTTSADIDISTLPAGNYILRLLDDNGATNLRFVKE
jgi:hypothetical protein